jgi:hypothetical protein
MPTVAMAMITRGSREVSSQLRIALHLQRLVPLLLGQLGLHRCYRQRCQGLGLVQGPLAEEGDGNQAQQVHQRDQVDEQLQGVAERYPQQEGKWCCVLLCVEVC